MRGNCLVEHNSIIFRRGQEIALTTRRSLELTLKAQPENFPSDRKRKGVTLSSRGKLKSWYKWAIAVVFCADQHREASLPLTYG